MYLCSAELFVVQLV